MLSLILDITSRQNDLACSAASCPCTECSSYKRSRFVRNCINLHSEWLSFRVWNLLIRSVCASVQKWYPEHVKKKMFAAPWKMQANDRGHRTLCQKITACILETPKGSMQKAISATWTDSISGIFKISTVPFSKIKRQLSTTLGHKLTKALINGIQLNFKQQIKDFWLVRTWQDWDRDQTCSNSDEENWAIASSLCSFEHSACAAKVASCSSSFTLRANASFLLVALLSKAHSGSSLSCYTSKFSCTDSDTGSSGSGDNDGAIQRTEHW
jgi:hypothetical protein